MKMSLEARILQYFVHCCSLAVRGLWMVPKRQAVFFSGLGDPEVYPRNDGILVMLKDPPWFRPAQSWGSAGSTITKSSYLRVTGNDDHTNTKIAKSLLIPPLALNHTIPVISHDQIIVNQKNHHSTTKITILIIVIIVIIVIIIIIVVITIIIIISPLSRCCEVITTSLASRIRRGW